MNPLSRGQNRACLVAFRFGNLPGFMGSLGTFNGVTAAFSAAPSVRPTSVEAARASGLIVALAAVSMFAACVISPAVLGDGDTWSHLKTGEWILAHSAIPRADPFSHSMPGAPWTAHEWLAEILLSIAFRAAGWSGIALVTGLAAGAASLILGLRLARDLEGLSLALALALGLGLWAPTLLARPHVLVLPLAALWTAGLVAARDRNAAPKLAMALLMTVWANMHGGFIFGLALIVPFALEAIAAAPKGGRAIQARAWGAFAAAAVLAALANPFGIEALIFPFRLMGVQNLSSISEWQAQDFSRFGPFAIALLALLGFALIRPMSAPPIRAGLVTGLIAMALRHARHAQLLGLVAPMLLARPIAAAIGARPPRDPGAVARTAIGASLACGLAMGALRLAAPLSRIDGPTAPIAALEAVPPALRGRPVLNDYGFGGYLIWSDVSPFIDGRADMYGGDMLGLYRKLASGDPPTLRATLARYRIAWTIFAPDLGVVSALDHEPGWRRLYADRFAVVHVRADGQ